MLRMETKAITYLRGTWREASVASISISILQMLSDMFFAMCGIIIHPHLNRPSQFLHSAMPAALGERRYAVYRWMKSDRMVSKLSFISKGRV